MVAADIVHGSGVGGRSVSTTTGRTLFQTDRRAGLLVDGLAVSGAWGNSRRSSRAKSLDELGWDVGGAASGSRNTVLRRRRSDMKEKQQQRFRD